MNDFEKLERYSPVIDSPWAYNSCECRAVVETGKDGCFVDFLEALIIYNRLLEENKALKKQVKEFEKQAKHVEGWSQIINMDDLR
jgi:hypothetical protein